MYFLTPGSLKVGFSEGSCGVQDCEFSSGLGFKACFVLH